MTIYAGFMSAIRSSLRDHTAQGVAHVRPEPEPIFENIPAQEPTVTFNSTIIVNGERVPADRGDVSKY